MGQSGGRLAWEGKKREGGGGGAGKANIPLRGVARAAQRMEKEECASQAAAAAAAAAAAGAGSWHLLTYDKHM